MSFDSPFFLCVFLPLCVLLFSLIPSKTLRKWVLLGVSVLFCGFGSLSGAGVLLVGGCLTFLCGQNNRQAWRSLGIGMNLALLCFYKFFVRTEIPVPFGISFFTFRCISYLADGKVGGCLSDFLLYVSFFPQLIAGPITRFGEFHLAIPSTEAKALGFRRFLWGLGKKALLVQPLSQLVASAYGSLSFGNAWLGAVSYMMQIFLDFSAYSDMAIGLSGFFGVTARENFDTPYTASSITEFWRRWHISLSHWFRDYVYIPLGGSRKGKTRAALNKLLVFTLCGLWHGTGWTFLLWGMWHGTLAALETLHPPKESVWTRTYTLLAVCIGFVLFRSSDLSQAGQILRAIFGFSGRTIPVLDGHQITVLAASAILCLPVEKWFQHQEARVTWLRPLSYILAFLLLVVSLGAIASGGFQPFIYAQF